MISQAKLEANRRNAQKSTGPRTPEGKAKCAMNGLKHGFTARQAVIDAFEDELFEEFADNITRELGPRTQNELVLVDDYIAVSWRIRRGIRFEGDMLRALMAAPGKSLGQSLVESGQYKALCALGNHECRAQRTRSRLLKEYLELREKPPVCNDAELETLERTGEKRKPNPLLPAQNDREPSSASSDQTAQPSASSGAGPGGCRQLAKANPDPTAEPAAHPNAFSGAGPGGCQQPAKAGPEPRAESAADPEGRRPNAENPIRLEGQSPADSQQERKSSRPSGGAQHRSEGGRLTSDASPGEARATVALRNQPTTPVPEGRTPNPEDRARQARALERLRLYQRRYIEARQMPDRRESWKAITSAADWINRVLQEEKYPLKMLPSEDLEWPGAPAIPRDW